MVSNRHILRQGPALSSLGKTALRAAVQSVRGAGQMPALPGPERTLTLGPRPADLVRAYLKVVGGDAKAWKGEVPPHFFPQWCFGLAAETLAGVPYPAFKIVNGGCRLESHRPLPMDKPLQVKAQLVGIDDDGRRAVIHQTIETGPAEDPAAVVAHLYPIVVLSRGDKKKRAERPKVPENAREVAFWKLSASKGLDFARVTGDFNPIHWIPAYARASGFKNTILHGFATMSMAMEGLQNGLYSGAVRFRVFDVRFTRPLVLPGRVGLYTLEEDGVHRVWVGDAPGGEIYMSGHFEVEELS